MTTFPTPLELQNAFIGIAGHVDDEIDVASPDAGKASN